jgi:hypothetical protein
MTHGEVSQLVAILMACYPNARVPDGTVVAYETFLRDLDYDRARAAIATIVRSSKFFPTIAEVVAAYEAQVDSGADVPYHRRFKPARNDGAMAPGELKAAIDDFLAGNKPEAASG